MMLELGVEMITAPCLTSPISMSQSSLPKPRIAILVKHLKTIVMKQMIAKKSVTAKRVRHLPSRLSDAIPIGRYMVKRKRFKK